MKALSRTSWYTKSVGILAFILLFLPIISMIFYSFVSEDPSSAKVFSLKSYRSIGDDPELVDSVFLSLKIAFFSSALSTLLGICGALALDKAVFYGHQLLNGLVFVPMVLPELVLGLGSLVWFNTLGFGLGPLAMTLAHATLTLPYALLLIRTRLRSLDPSLALAASDLGASQISQFFHLKLAHLLPSIVGAMLLCFTISFDDVLISFFTAGADSDTLPIKLYGRLKYGLSTEVYAISTLVMASAGILLFLLRSSTLLKRRT